MKRLLVPERPILFRKLLMYWDFPHTATSGVYREWLGEKQQSSSDLGENVLFMPGVKGEWPVYFELTGRQQ